MAPVVSKLDRATIGQVGTKKKFEGSSFTVAAKLILASPDGAVKYRDLSERVGSAELEIMVKSNLLGVLPHSDWTGDVDTEANKLKSVRCVLGCGLQFEVTS